MNSTIKNTSGYRNTPPAEMTGTMWWLDEHLHDRAARVWDIAAQLWINLGSVRKDMEWNARLYGGTQMLGLTPRYFNHSRMTLPSNQLSLNVVESVTDTYVAMLTHDKPKVSFITSGGDYTLQKKASQLTTYVDGIFYDADVYETAFQVAVDSAIFGEGIVKVYHDRSESVPKIRIERVLPIEILVDDQEARYGDPQTMYQVKWIDKARLMADYPDQAEAIQNAASGGFDTGSGSNNFDGVESAQLAVVIEAWHLPRSSDAGDGRHVICCGDVVLLDEPWERKGFPFVWLYRSRPLLGVYARSLCGCLRGVQKEINTLLAKIQRAMHLVNGCWLIDRNSKVDTSQINNEIGAFIRHNGNPPVYQAATAVDGAVYQHLWNLYQKAYEVIGVSQTAAQSQKPQGLNSGKALLVYADIQAERFEPAYRHYQGFFLKLARQVITLSRELEDEFPDFEVRAAGKGIMKTVRWADANLEDEEFILQMMPTNKMADDIPSRIEEVQELANAGWIGPEDAKRLLDFPDLQQANSYANSSYDLVMEMVDSIVEEGIYMPPEPFIQNLDQQIARVQQAYCKARVDGVPEERLEMLRQWMAQAQDLLKPPPPAQAPPPAPPGPPKPPMVPPPPQTSIYSGQGQG